MVTPSTIKKGYKQTDIGIIPEDWDVVVFENIADKTKKWNITGGPFGSNLKVSDYTNEGVQIIQLQNIGDGKFIDDYQIFTSEEKANELLSCNIYPNEIILSKMGDPVARACFIPNKASRYLMASDGIRLVVNEKDFSKKFIHDYINSIYFRKRAFEISTGSTRLRISLPELKRLLVIKPPKSEQTAIATILSDTDALIERLEKLIAKKIAIKQGTMQQLLTGKKRLPGFSGKWEVKNLLETIDCLDNLRVPLNDIQRLNMKGDHPYCGANGILDHINKYMIDDDIILIAEDGGYFDEYSYRPIAYKMRGKCWVNNHAHILKAKENFSQDYIFYSLVHKNILSFLASGTRAKLNKSEMYKIEIDIPQDKTEQTTIAHILNDMDADIENLKQKLDKYTMLKQGMMQQLLTGRIRIHATN